MFHCVYVYLYTYTHTTFYPFIYQQTHYFYVLAIVNKAAMNVGVRVPFRIRVFSGYMDHMATLATLFLVF